MPFSNRVFSVLLSAIILNIILPIKAQSLTGTSVILGRKHYYIETTHTGNFFEAAHTCAQYDMTLASIENKNEHDQLFSILKTTENLDKQYWTSGTSYGTSAAPFKWLATGKSVKYIPNTAALTWAAAKCLATAVTSFEYEVKDCTGNESSFYFICEKPLEPNCGKLGQCRYTYSYNSN